MNEHFPLGTLIFQFQNINSNPFNAAVSASSCLDSCHEYVFNHVGIIIDKNVVAEAVTCGGVQCLSLSSFLYKGLVNKATLFKSNVPIDKIISNIHSCIGKPYNKTFYPEAEGYYCSELITQTFNKFLTSNLCFKLYPMNFKDSAGNFISFWISYFQALNCAIPQDILGSNPFNLYQQQYLYKEIITI